MCVELVLLFYLYSQQYLLIIIQWINSIPFLLGTLPPTTSKQVFLKERPKPWLGLQTKNQKASFTDFLQDHLWLSHGVIGTTEFSDILESNVTKYTPNWQFWEYLEFNIVFHRFRRLHDLLTKVRS